MAFRLKIEDCGGEDHYVTIDNDGRLIIDPKAHDIDLERSLIALGGKEPKCFTLEARHLHNPFSLVGDVKHMLRDDPSVLFYAVGVYSLLACDFIEHVLRKIPTDAGPRRRVLVDALADAREYYKLPDMLIPYDQRQRDTMKGHEARNQLLLRGDVIVASLDAPDVKSDKRVIPIALTRLSLAFHQMSRGVIRNTYNADDLHYVSGLCSRGRGMLALTESKPRLRTVTLATGRESDWQIARMVEVLTAIIEGKPWPSL